MEAATARLRGAPAEPGPQRTLDRLRSDRKLVERYRDGDEAAFARLYERHRARVFAICLGVLGSREDAQDALQEVFASVAAELRREPPRELRPWIARVARNAAIDAARTRRPASNGDEDAMDERASDGTVQTVERRDDIRDLLRGLRDLPEQQRTALVMRELGGDSYADIGAALGVDETAVRGLIARARLSLRARIAAQAMACEIVRQGLAAETDGRRRTSSIRRHLRECESCREFNAALRADSKTLRALAPTGAGLSLLALVTAWRGPKAVVAGGLIAKSALSSGAAQVAVVCVAALCAAGGAEQFVEQQRKDADSSASARADALAAPENTAARTGLRANGGSALPAVGALQRARLTTPASGKRAPATTTRRKDATTPASTKPARDRTTAGGDRKPTTSRGVNGGAGKDRDVPRRDNGGDGKRGWREDDSGSNAGGGADKPAWQPERDSGYGGRNPNWPQKPPGYEGGGAPVQVPGLPAPTVTESVPEAPTVPVTGTDGS